MHENETSVCALNVRYDNWYNRFLNKCWRYRRLRSIKVNFGSPSNMKKGKSFRYNLRSPSWGKSNHESSDCTRVSPHQISNTLWMRQLGAKAYPRTLLTKRIKGSSYNKDQIWTRCVNAQYKYQCWWVEWFMKCQLVNLNPY